MVFTKGHSEYRKENWKENLSNIAIDRKLGKHIRTKKIKSKMYTSKRNENISKSLMGRKLTEQHNLNAHKHSYKKGIESPIFGKKLSKETKMKISKSNQGKILTEEHKRKILKVNPKSSLEIKFEKIAEELKLPYKFVGDGELFIGKKCPDFINAEGEKIAVEVFYRKQKEMFRGGLDKWKQDRLNLFKQNGWDLKFFDETQVNEKCLTQFRDERRN